MSDLLFRCSRCSTSLVVDEGSAGAVFDCPECGGEIEVPKAAQDIACPSCNVSLAAAENVNGEVCQCPECNSPISVVSEAASKREILRLHPEPEPPPEKTCNCPECDSPMAEDDVICVNCGLNVKTGERIKTKTR